MTNNEKKYVEKRERILNAINFKPVDRLPYSGSCLTVDSIEKITGRNDYLTNANEVFAEAHRAFDVDLLLQFVLPDRQDTKTGPYAELDVRNTGLWSVLYGMVGAWIKEHGEFTSPEDIRDFCLSLPDASQANEYFDSDNIYQEWIKLDKWGDFLKPTVWLPCSNAGVDWMWYSSMGYENYLMAHLLYPDSSKIAATPVAELGTRRCDAFLHGCRVCFLAGIKLRRRIESTIKCVAPFHCAL